MRLAIWDLSSRKARLGPITLWLVLWDKRWKLNAISPRLWALSPFPEEKGWNLDAASYKTGSHVETWAVFGPHIWGIWKMLCLTGHWGDKVWRWEENFDCLHLEHEFSSLSHALPLLFMELSIFTGINNMNFWLMTTFNPCGVLCKVA